MQTYRVPFGRTSQQLELPDEFQVSWIDPAEISAETPPADVVQQALDNPLESFRWEDVRNARTVAIAINDNTRPVAQHLIIPSLLSKLEEQGFSPENIHFFIANGTHIPLQPDAFSQILPEYIYQRYTIHSHSSDDKPQLTYLGETPAGTPVWVNTAFHNSDLKIVVGNIEPHHFAGFSGGMKTAAIGLAGRETITANHAMLLEAGSKAGIFEGNPLREDIEQIGQMMQVHLALNVVMNARKEFLKAYFGEPLAVMAAGIPMSCKVSQTTVDGLFDVVISSPGGHPKDINFYQAQKGITHAAGIVRQGGAIVLCAACPEGAGSMSYERFMDGISSHDAVLEKFKREGFQVGPHKAIQVALIARRAQILLVSSLPDSLVEKLLLRPAASLQAALAGLNLSPSAKIAILPHATNTIPQVVSQP